MQFTAMARLRFVSGKSKAASVGGREKIGLRLRRIEQSDDDPTAWVLMHDPH
jgi:hypothetical protein